MAVHLRETFTCQVCNKGFSQKRTLIRHMKRCHTSLSSTVPSEGTLSAQVRDVASVNKDIPHECFRHGDGLPIPLLNLKTEFACSNSDEP